MSRDLVLGVLALAGCPDEAGGTWLRMLDQPRIDAYEPVPWSTDGLRLRRPPAGTVSREHELEPLVPRDLAEPPIEADADLLARGRDRYERFCGPCHGTLGFGRVAVSRAMVLRPPPSLHEPRIQGLPAGRIYGVVRDGWGLMPGYCDRLDRRDRWAVVTWLRVLWLSQSMPIRALPPALRRQAEEALAHE